MPSLLSRLLPVGSPFDTLRAEHQAQFGVSIAHVKAQVGPGTEYVNETARAVFSPQGGWFELSEMPEEFAGATGIGVFHRLLPRPEIAPLLARWTALLDLAAAGRLPWRKFSLYAIYEGGSLRERRGAFVLDSAPGVPLFTAGAWQPDVVPRLVKVCVHDMGTGPAAGQFGLPARGVQLFLVPTHTDNGGALLATLAPAPSSTDLGALPGSPTAH